MVVHKNAICSEVVSSRSGIRPSFMVKPLTVSYHVYGLCL